MTMLNGVNFTRTGNPQADLETYAAARGISEADAREELEAEFGTPASSCSNCYDSDDEDVSVCDSDDDSCSTSCDDDDSCTSETDDDDASSEFEKTAEGRTSLEETIQYWRAKLKEATDAKDCYGVAYAQKQIKKYSELAYDWDKNYFNY